MAEDRMFKLQIISPDRIFYTGEVQMVELETSEGEIGILKNHIPLTAVLVPGIVTIHEAEETRRAAIHAGFVEILQDEVTVMAEVAEWPDEIDANRAEEARVRAERILQMKDPNLNINRAKLALRKSLTRLELKKEEK